MLMVPLPKVVLFVAEPMTILSVPETNDPFVPIRILLVCKALFAIETALSPVPSVIVPDATLRTFVEAPTCILLVPETIAPFVAIKTFVSWIPAVPMDMDAPDALGMLKPILIPEADAPKLHEPAEAPNEHAKLFEHINVLYVCVGPGSV